MPEPRSGAVRLSRRRELSMAGLSWAARGLLHRLAIDVAWRPRTLRTVAGVLHLEPGEALVSLAAYAREAGGTWRTVRKLLDELSAAGWVEARTGPDGTVVRLLARLDVDPAEGGGLCSADTTPSAQRAQPYSNTPAVTPRKREGPNGCCLSGSSQNSPRARDVDVAPAPVPDPSVPASSPPPPLGLPRAMIEACRRAGVSPGLARELLDRGYDEAHVLGRLLQLGEALAGGRAVRNPPGWLRDKLRRGHAPEALHEVAKGLLGLSAPRLPLSWLPAATGAEPISEILARALSPPGRAVGA